MNGPTKPLYYEDSYMRSCTAVVQECIPQKDLYAVVLDQTCFYPEGGGQPGDTGTLDQIPVLDTHKKDGRILHYTESPLAPGETVVAEINWERRFDLMQQHSGEHMVSGVIHQRFGYDNIGFHMGEEITTIDFSGKLTPEQLREVEDEVNQMIWRNEPVHAWIPPEQERTQIPYRSKKELSGDVRIVEFPDADICACCGMHVRQTGAIGLVKIIHCENFHEGVRLELLCGARATRYLGRIFEENRSISHLLSAKPLETANAVSSLANDLQDQRRKRYALEEVLFSARAEVLTGAGDVLLFLEDLDSDGVRRACDAVQKTCGGRAAVFSGTDDTGYSYAIGLPGGDLKEFTKNMNAALKGRGGGKPFFVQGRVSAKAADIKAYFE